MEINLEINRSNENDSGGSDPTEKEIKSFVANSLQSTRKDMSNKSVDFWDEIYESLRYDKEIEPEKRIELWERNPIANSIVERPPSDTWRKPPRILNKSDESVKLPFIGLNELVRVGRKADRLQRLHGLALIVVGTRNEFLEEEPSSEPTYLEAYSLPDLTDEGWEVETDRSSENYGDPRVYFLESEEEGGEPIQIHADRVFPVAELTLEHDLDPYSALDPNFNALTNIVKVLGGNSEAHYKLASPPLHFNFEGGISDETEKALNVEMQKFRSGLTDYIALGDADVEELSGKPTKVESTIDLNIAFISAQTNIPKRILLGSESGELASTQDQANWYAHIDHRRSRVAEEMILRPYLDFLEKNYSDFSGYESIEWEDLFELNEIEKSEILMNRASALKNISSALAGDGIGFDDVFGDAGEVRSFLGIETE